MLSLPLFLADVYVPGDPGANWSEEEIIIVKAKLQSVLRRGGSEEALRQLRPPGTPGSVFEESGRLNWTYSDRIPDAPKMLRLGFHDCLK